MREEGMAKRVTKVGCIANERGCWDSTIVALRERTLKYGS